MSHRTARSADSSASSPALRRAVIFADIVSTLGLSEIESQSEPQVSNAPAVPAEVDGGVLGGNEPAVEAKWAAIAKAEAAKAAGAKSAEKAAEAETAPAEAQAEVGAGADMGAPPGGFEWGGTF